MGRYTRHMSASERRARDRGDIPVTEGREDFVRDNAVSLLRERDAYIARLRQRARQLQRSNETYRERDREFRATIARLEFERNVILTDERLRRMTPEQWTQVLVWAADFESRVRRDYVPPGAATEG